MNGYFQHPWSQGYRWLTGKPISLTSSLHLYPSIYIYLSIYLGGLICPWIVSPVSRSVSHVACLAKHCPLSVAIFMIWDKVLVPYCFHTISSEISLSVGTYVIWQNPTRIRLYRQTVDLQYGDTSTHFRGPSQMFWSIPGTSMNQFPSQLNCAFLKTKECERPTGETMQCTFEKHLYFFVFI